MTDRTTPDGAPLSSTSADGQPGDPSPPTPEPRPAVGAVSRVALAQARDDARERLTLAYANDLIDADELDQRLETLENAEQLPVVASLVADLAPAPGAPAVSSVPATIEPQVIDGRISGPPAVIDVPEKSSTVAIFSGSRRAGSWVPARYNRVLSVFGGVELDLRESPLPPGEIEINLVGAFTGVEILVPPGTRVQLECSTVFGGVEQQDGAETPTPGGTTIRVTGLVIFGGVEIVERYPGESGWAARKRRKADRKQLRAAAKAKAKALPPKR